ncbi:glycoside hydrolase family 13 protein [Aulographum hederae CBS 113979]|uniref:Glycoside hydrolase family 13 protein n=1 Tax=Aulographum hederae CBS 113979 TaxID=1176131 RepID=A0A6G1GL00_9PEZI|nr:glycoside hydrolase family 13 protein [Aulographum hederae CBS 113979]
MPEDRKPTPDNHCFLQGFEWYVPADQKHWQRLLGALPDLKAAGIDNLWIPPACKASSNQGNGYDIYDLYDLGEFDQKGGKSTKWGPKEELLELSDKAQELGIGLYLDAVLNHKAGADEKEKCMAVEVDQNDRTKEVGDPYEINAWVGFTFPGRGDKYSTQKYHWYHMTGTDYNADNDKTAIYKIVGDNKRWAESVDTEQGNADYMMFADLDYHHDEVCADVKNWGVWVTKELKLKGMRLDAVQHFSERFTNEFVSEIRKECGNDQFMVGEFWVGDQQTMSDWLEKMERKFSLFDAPLLYNFASISKQEKADLRKVFDGSLVSVQPQNAVTVIMNHDTERGQVMETPIEGFFKPLAYCLILLRSSGYPCIFYGDLYGIKGEYAEPPSCGEKLPDMILARKLYAYGDQEDYWDDPNCIGWVRRGTWDKPAGLACLMSNAEPGQIRMAVGDEHNGEVWTDVLGWSQEEVTIEDGYGTFSCSGISVSIYVRKDAEGRDKFPVKFNSNIYGE